MLRWSQQAHADSNKVTLPPLIPPFRYSVVEGSNRQEALYRSAFPTSKNFRFLKRLQLKTIISLIPKNGEGEQDLRQFCSRNSIHHEIFPVSGNQEPLAKDENDFNAPAPTHALCANVLTLCIDPDRLPLLIHDTNGAHVTGLIIALLRRLQNYSMDFYIEEFIRFTKNHYMDDDEQSFIARFFLEVTLPRRLPNWLWGGERLSRHPTLPLFGAAVSVGIANEDWSQDVASSVAAVVSTSEHFRQEEEMLIRHMSSSTLTATPPPSSSFSLSSAVKSMVNEDDEEEDGPRGLALEGPASLFRRRSTGL